MASITKLFKPRNEKREKMSLLTVIMCIILAVYCIVLLALIFWGLITVLKHPEEFLNGHNRAGLPKYVFLDKGGNFVRAMKLWHKTTPEETTFVESLLNSILYAAGGAFINTLVQCLTAYLCARYKYKLSKIVYGAVIVAMILPIVGSLASEIEMAKRFGLYDQIWGTWIMKANFLGLYFLVFHEMFSSMPMAYSEAAKIDGANDWSILWKIAFPLAVNTFMTVLLINFVALWNDFQMSLVYLPTHHTMAECVHRAFETTGDFTAPPLRFAFTFILMTPILILFLCFHKRLLGNLTIGGVKG